MAHILATEGRANLSSRRSVAICKEENGGGNLNRPVKHWAKMGPKGYLGENNSVFFEKLKWK